jgi:hypothetical protein
MSTSIFERMFVATDLERGMAETLALWYPTYTEELRLQRGMPNALALPRSITNRDDVLKYPEDQLPAIIVASTGLAPFDPMEEGDGTIRAWWELGIGIVASAATEKDTELVTKMHGTIVRTIMLQQGTATRVCSGIRWIDESYDDIAVEEQERSLGASVLSFYVLIDDVVNRWAGPTEPPGTPGAQWPTADTIIIDIELIPLLEDLRQ